MIDQEYFDSINVKDEDEINSYTTNDYSDTIEKSHITTIKTSTSITTLNMIIFIILAIILIIIITVFVFKSYKKDVKNNNTLNKK